MRKTTVSVSVIIPVHNQEIYISRCLRSILDQSLAREEYEVIVIDDDSKDKTGKILQTFKNHIKIISNKKNKGLSFSLNRGIENSKGRFIVRLDSDDYVNKEYLKILQMYLLYNNDSNAVSCDYFLVDEKENILKKENSKTKPIGCGIMFRAESLINVGMYDKNFLVHEDRDLRIRFKKKYVIDRIALPLYRYRKHQKNITKDKKKMKLHYTKLVKKHKK